MSGKHLSALFRQIGRGIFHETLNPRICIACESILEHSGAICCNCLKRLELETNPCKLCGLSHSTGESICAKCLYDPPRWDRMIAPYAYRNLIRDLLIQLKFSDNLTIADSLTRQLSVQFKDQVPPEVLIPVPLFKKRLIERGYNQAYEIARCLSIKLDIPLNQKSLIRTRHTESQSGLSAAKREKNIRSAFSFNNSANYKHVAVVDDIITTGSTLNEITRILKRAGVEKVEVWGLARVGKFD